VRNLPIQGPAIKALTHAAREYSRYRPTINPQGFEARALMRLCEASQVNCKKSDEQWAAEVAFLKDAMRRAIDRTDHNTCRQVLTAALGEHDDDVDA
jgi:hypothetical protein